MSIIKKNSQPFEPYARLMNIIGDQLITDKKVAVIEVVKNSYDADAGNVQVRFFNMDNYGKNYLTEKEQPYIEIEDDGDGMSLNTVTDIWLRPATPSKLDKKKNKENRTKKGRLIQGEKGIGRFAIHKLGEKIEVFTKAINNHEIKVTFDFTEFNPEKIDLFNQPATDYKLLKDVNNNWFENDPPEEIKKQKGTLIRIYNLRERWSSKDLVELTKAINRLIPPIDPASEQLNVKITPDFDVKMYLDNRLFVSEDTLTFTEVIERAQFRINGILKKTGDIEFKYSCVSPVREISRKLNILNKKEFAKYNYSSWAIDTWFKESDRTISCGEIKFSLYAFNLAKRDKTVITDEVMKFLKENFVYVLRDGLRVYPYGEKGIDWLNLDKLRAVIKAGQFPSYYDLLGFIYIGQESNPKLKDSTNRQGIMDIDGAYEDFVNGVTAITEIFNTEIKIDKAKIEVIKNKSFRDSNAIINRSFNSLITSLTKIDNREVLEKANRFLDDVKNHNLVMRDRMETVEDLAGLGMAVEKASHDALMLLAKMRANIKDFKLKAKNKDYSNNELLDLLDETDENLNFVYEEMQIIQPLFKIQRKAIHDVSIYENIEKVVKYFRRELENKINVQIIKDKDIIIKTNNGLILQILINTIDNAIYWVNKIETDKKEIIIKLNSETKTLLIADNGPGIREDVEPLIFNEFFSLKSDGRGLGLYIVKEILLRINGEISIIQDDKKKALPGANFIIKFNNEQQ